MLQCKVFMVCKGPPITDFLYYCRQWFFLIDLHELGVGTRPFYGHLDDVRGRRHCKFLERPKPVEVGSYGVDGCTCLYLPGVAGRRRRGFPAIRSLATPRLWKGSRRVCRPAQGPGGVSGSASIYPVPILARSRLSEHTHLHSGSAGCCAAGCRCSHFLFLPPAGQRHILHLQGIPRLAANSPTEQTLRSGRRRPRHLRRDPRGWRVRFQPAPCCLPTALRLGGMGVPTTF